MKTHYLFNKIFQSVSENRLVFDEGPKAGPDASGEAVALGSNDKKAEVKDEAGKDTQKAGDEAAKDLSKPAPEAPAPQPEAAPAEAKGQDPDANKPDEALDPKEELDRLNAIGDDGKFCKKAKDKMNKAIAADKGKKYSDGEKIADDFETNIIIGQVADILNQDASKGAEVTPENISAATRFYKLHPPTLANPEKNGAKRIFNLLQKNEVALLKSGIKINFEGGTDGTKHKLVKDEKWHKEKAAYFQKLLDLDEKGNLYGTALTDEQKTQIGEYITAAEKGEGYKFLKEADKTVKDSFLKGGGLMDRALAVYRAEDIKKRIFGKSEIISLDDDSVSIAIGTHKHKNSERNASVFFSFLEPGDIDDAVQNAENRANDVDDNAADADDSANHGEEPTNDQDDKTKDGSGEKANEHPNDTPEEKAARAYYEKKHVPYKTESEARADGDIIDVDDKVKPVKGLQWASSDKDSKAHPNFATKGKRAKEKAPQKDKKKKEQGPNPADNKPETVDQHDQEPAVPGKVPAETKLPAKAAPDQKPAQPTGVPLQAPAEKPAQPTGVPLQAPAEKPAQPTGVPLQAPAEKPAQPKVITLEPPAKSAPAQSKPAPTETPAPGSKEVVKEAPKKFLTINNDEITVTPKEGAAITYKLTVPAGEKNDFEIKEDNTVVVKLDGYPVCEIKFDEKGIARTKIFPGEQYDILTDGKNIKIVDDKMSDKQIIDEIARAQDWKNSSGDANVQQLGRFTRIKKGNDYTYQIKTKNATRELKYNDAISEKPIPSSGIPLKGPVQKDVEQAPKKFLIIKDDAVTVAPKEGVPITYHFTLPQGEKNNFEIKEDKTVVVKLNGYAACEITFDEKGVPNDKILPGEQYKVDIRQGRIFIDDYPKNDEIIIFTISQEKGWTADKNKPSTENLGRFYRVKNPTKGTYKYFMRNAPDSPIKERELIDKYAKFDEPQAHPQAPANAAPAGKEAAKEAPKEFLTLHGKKITVSPKGKESKTYEIDLSKGEKIDAATIKDDSLVLTLDGYPAVVMKFDKNGSPKAEILPGEEYAVEFKEDKIIVKSTPKSDKQMIEELDKAKGWVHSKESNYEVLGRFVRIKLKKGGNKYMKNNAQQGRYLDPGITEPVTPQPEPAPEAAPAKGFERAPITYNFPPKTEPEDKKIGADNAKGGHEKKEGAYEFQRHGEKPAPKSGAERAEPALTKFETPDISDKDADKTIGEKIQKMEEFIGKKGISIVEFSASDSKSCQTMNPLFATLATKGLTHGSDKIRFANFNQNNTQDGRDPNSIIGKFNDKYSVTAFPTLAIFKDGNMLVHTSGNQGNKTAAELETRIVKLLEQ